MGLAGAHRGPESNVSYVGNAAMGGWLSCAALPRPRRTHARNEATKTYGWGQYSSSGNSPVTT